MSATGPTRAERIDAIYQGVNAWLCASQWDRVDRRLAVFNVEADDVRIALAWLTITLAARSRLPSREAFCKRVEARLAALGRTPAEVDNALRGLR